MVQIRSFRMSSARRLVLGLVGVAISGALANGCVSQMSCDVPTEPCVETGGPGEAAVTAVAAGALWAGAGGCTTNGCRPPYVCNTGSGLCEHMRCGEGVGGCPPGTECDS